MTRQEAAEALRGLVLDEVGLPPHRLHDAVTALAQEDPSKDGTQGATPAYWRGFSAGQSKAAALLMHVLSEEPLSAVAFLDAREQDVGAGHQADLLRCARAVLALRGRRAK